MKCKSCKRSFDPDTQAVFDVDSEEMMAEIERETEKGERCPDCIFDTAFENQTRRDWAYREGPFEDDVEGQEI